MYREFARLERPIRRLPDEGTILQFRHLQEKHHLGDSILVTVNETLQRRGLMLKAGTVVDTALIAAPSSTKNDSGERDPEIHQSKKGNQWRFGTHARVGTDAELGLVHTVVGTTAHVNEVTQGHELLHGEEQVVFADAGYQVVMKRSEATGVTWHVATRPGKRRALDLKKKSHRLIGEIGKLKASVRVEIEHVFKVIKLQFGFTKVRHHGLAKNTAQLKTLSALTNSWMVRRKLLAGVG